MMTKHSSTPPVRSRLSLLLPFLWMLLCSLHARGAEILYIGPGGHPDQTRQQVAAAADFYGVAIHNLVPRQGMVTLPPLTSSNLVAIVVAADMLPALTRRQTLTLLRGRRPGVPLLVAGITDRTPANLLQGWSGGSITACRRSPLASSAAGRYEVTDVSEITGPLSGYPLPLSLKWVFYLELSAQAQSLLQARFFGPALPVFARTAPRSLTPDVFFATEQPATDIPLSSAPYRQQPVFASLASPLLFLRYAAGERAWHTPANYANFTVDDPWLREPYGHVNFHALLEQARQHRFHATIALIPWNFDRSQPTVVRLFRDHPDLLSIAIHGNDHVHQEFGPLLSHPLEEQVQNAEQALARMAAFSRLTHIPYDRIMIFPHSISPVATLSILHRNNYLATVNSLNVPSDVSAPSGLEFALRTDTLQFASFPSLRRYSAETNIPPSQLAIDAFLGNPILFYAHESFFASGMTAFNNTADLVNRIQPSTEWRSLGDIVQHLYRERLRDDGDVEIRALSGSLRLLNSRNHETTFLIDKQEDPSLPLKVLVDGQATTFLRTADHVSLQLSIPAGATRLIQFEVSCAHNIAVIDISRRSYKTTAIRLLSDFRDNVVSDTLPGRWFIRSYVEHGRNWNLAFALLALVAFLFATNLHRSRRGTPLPGISAL